MATHDQESLETVQELATLFFRKLQGTLDPAGDQQLEKWLGAQSEESRKFYENLTDQESIESALRAFYAIDEAAALEDVLNRIREDSHETTPSGRITNMFKQRAWYRYAAAAILILIVGIAITFWLSGRTGGGLPASTPTAQYNSEALPGSDKAILQLENGRSILLDSVSGEVATEGGTQILKQKDGAISYEAGKAEADTAMVYNRIITPRGGQYQVSLPDGTKVWLNAASSLRFPVAFKGNERVVELTGEAYFAVAKQAEKPFRVIIAGSAEPMQVDVLGTEFNIQAYADEPVQATTVVNGKVKVVTGDQGAVLLPGQQASRRKDALITTTADMEAALAWKNGMIYLQDASIQTIMRQLSRWYNVDVEYTGTITQQFVGKIPRNMNLSDVLRVLESTGWVHFTFEGNKVTVSP